MELKVVLRLRDGRFISRAADIDWKEAEASWGAIGAPGFVNMCDM